MSSYADDRAKKNVRPISELLFQKRGIFTDLGESSCPIVKHKSAKLTTVTFFRPLANRVERARILGHSSRKHAALERAISFFLEFVDFFRAS